jgi:hypothetical protein
MVAIPSMTTKKIVGLVAVGVILYELWKREQSTMYGGPENIQTNRMSSIPLWGQQLSSISGTTTTDVLGDLLTIPQGPGGSDNYGYGNFFGGAECILPPLA